MSHLVQDLRFAVRSFVRAPRFTVPAVLALALGIGATTAIFSVVRGVMLKPLPYRDPDRIVAVWENNLRRNRPRNVIASANFVEWRERNRSFEYLGMSGPARLTFTLGGVPEEVVGRFASADVFPALGVQPAMGRAYSTAEDQRGNDGVIVLSHEFWQRRLGGRLDVLGTPIIASGRQRTVVGIMPPRFTILGEKTDFLIPYGWTIERLRSSPGRGSSHGIARLRDGVTLQQATSDMTNIMSTLEKEAPQRNTGWSITLVPVHEQMVDQIRPALNVLAGAVALVLLIACVNVANLLLARSTARQQELGLRAALGARRGRLVTQLLSESMLLAVVGGLAGLVLAFAFHRGLLALVADRIPIPRLDQVALDLPVLGFALLLSLFTGLVFGFLPAWMASHTINEALHEGGRHSGGPKSRRALATLVVAEVALSLVLLTGAGLLIRSFIRLQNINPGFQAAGLFTARVSLPASGYDDDRKIGDFFSSVVSRIRSVPGVRSAAGVSFLPLSGPGIGTSFYRTDKPIPAAGDQPITEVRPVTPDFFRTMGITQLAGRDISEADRVDSPQVAVVSDTLVKRYFADENPVGRRIHVSIGSPEGRDYEIIGVVGDIKMSSLDAETRPAVYIPHTQLAIGLMTLVARSDLDPLALTGSISAVVHSLDKELPLADVKTMEQVVDATIARPRVIAVLLTTFAVMALILAAVGVYGVMAYSVAQRTREIGVRMALGATATSVFRLVISQALRLVGIGVITGVIAAGGFMQLLKTLLYDTEPLDPWTFVITTVVLTMVAAIASYVPARRGTRVDPVQALRAE